MKEHRPDLDRLSAYVEDALSPDARRSLEQHLAGCGACREALEREGRLLRRLDGLARIEPPPDFVQAVMGRVAQYPAYRPAPAVPWRRVLAWSAGLAAALVAVLGVGAWQIAGQPGADARLVDLLHRTAVGLVEVGGMVFRASRQVLEPASTVVEALAKAVHRVSTLAASSGRIVQATILLLTVMLNYAFTRMVLNYQRRN